MSIAETKTYILAGDELNMTIGVPVEDRLVVNRDAVQALAKSHDALLKLCQNSTEAFNVLRVQFGASVPSGLIAELEAAIEEAG